MRDKAGELVAPDMWLTEDMLAPDGEDEPGDEGACGADASGEDGRAPFELPAPAYSSMERYREFVDGCFGRRGGFNPQDPVHRQVRIMLMCGAVIYTLADGREVVVPAPEVLTAVFPGKDFSPRSQLRSAMPQHAVEAPRGCKAADCRSWSLLVSPDKTLL